MLVAAVRFLAATSMLYWMASSALCDTLLDQGQQLIDKGKYQQAISIFSQYIDLHPTDVAGYRGRIEAKLLLRRYSDCVGDYARVTAKVIPHHPNAPQQIYDYYAARLSAKPNDLKAQIGLSFAHWWYFEYETAIQRLNHILSKDPNNRTALLMRASSRLLSQLDRVGGLNDLRQATAMDANNPHLRFIAADAFTYGEHNYTHALAQAALAMLGGLDTPRLHAILATCYNNFGFDQLAAEETLEHFSMVTTAYVPSQTIHPGETAVWDLEPGQTIVIPLHLNVGEALDVVTDGPTGTVWDTILVLLDSNDCPVASADDVNDYYAALHWSAPQAGDYKLMVTSFESVQSGPMTVTRW